MSPLSASPEFDLCIVGGGPAGLTLAHTLAKPGRRVCLVESGRARPTRRAQRLARGQNAGMPYFRLDRARVRALGGSSWRWLSETGDWGVDGGLRCRPFDEFDLAPRPHVPHSGWPLTSADFEPYYRRAHDLLKLRSYDYRLAAWVGDANEPPLALGDEPVETAICQFAPPDTFVEMGRALLRDRDVTVLTGATALELISAPGSERITAIRVASEGGTSEIRAQTFVLAGGGIDNPRLLLASPIGAPGAPANRYDQVGRHFMEHIQVESGVFRPAPGVAFDAFRFYRRQTVRGAPILGVLRVASAAQEAEDLLNSIVTFKPREELFLSPAVRSFAELRWAALERSRPSEVRAHLATALRDPIPVMKAAARTLRGVQESAFAGAHLVLTAEQAPNPRSRVTLSSKRDEFGMPLPRLEWQLTDLDHRSIRRTQEIMGEALRSAGYGRVEGLWGDVRPGPRVHGCWHHAGTTRMSADPREGVVDSDCRVHGVENLYAAGSSVFPTCGATTVTLSIVALALRLAGHLEAALPAG
ncbi:MAG TPA: GMC family oxidoreductase [Tepidiformaceae bacterium]|nr:GMC family oxidoreductase [Tepidiformaceae bacterium]